MIKLEQQVQVARRTVRADSISMSISELTSLYKEDVLVIQPEFQRLFRWDDNQKSRLIESILLGIPLPSIFISQEEDSGKWELVDGLQRVGTLLELQGLFPGRPPLKLKATSYLPDLADRFWGDGEGQSLTSAQILDIRLARLDLRILKRSSDKKAKFDLFQRLNSYGSPLTAQEVRTAMIVGINSDVLPWLQRLAEHPGFIDSLALGDRLIDEQFDLDLLLRFLMLHDYDFSTPRSGLSDFPLKLDKWAKEFAETFPRNAERLSRVFDHTFSIIGEYGPGVIFKKWNADKYRFTGGFSSSSYEAIALGLAYHVAHNNPYREDLEQAAKLLWSKEIPEKIGTTTGLPTGDRIAKTVPLGRDLLQR